MSKGNPAGYPRVQGVCPSCRSHSLFLGEGGYVTCSVLGCRDPGLATDLLMLGDALGKLVTAARAMSAAEGSARREIRQAGKESEGAEV